LLINILKARHQSIGSLLEQQSVNNVYQKLRSIGDIERILTRIALKTARPRDLSNLRTALGNLPELQKHLVKIDNPNIQNLAKQIGIFPGLYDLLKSAIVENPPMLVRDGGVIAPKYDKSKSS
jgi:DNA mismatch repair protein MutS